MAAFTAASSPGWRAPAVDSEARASWTTARAEQLRLPEATWAAGRRATAAAERATGWLPHSMTTTGSAAPPLAARAFAAALIAPGRSVGLETHDCQCFSPARVSHATAVSFWPTGDFGATLSSRSSRAPAFHLATPPPASSTPPPQSLPFQRVSLPCASTKGKGLEAMFLQHPGAEGLPSGPSDVEPPPVVETNWQGPDAVPDATGRKAEHTLL